MEHHIDPDRSSRAVGIVPLPDSQPTQDPEADARKLEELFKASHPKLASEDPSPPKPSRLTEVDRLKLENVSLKLMNVGVQFEKLAIERARLSRQFDELRKECLERYGVDIATTKIDEDGNFCGPLLTQQALRPQGLKA